MKHIASLLLLFIIQLTGNITLSEGFVFPDISGPSPSSAVGTLLPNPAFYFDNEPELTQSDYFTDNKTFDVYTFTGTPGLRCNEARWLDDCRAANFAVSQGRVGGENAWVIQGEKTAFYFPEHGSSILIMVETGLALTQMPSKAEYVYVTWNGKVAAYDNKLQMNKHGTLHNEYVIELAANAELNSILFTIPSYAQSGDEFVTAYPLPGIPGVELQLTMSGGLPKLYVFGDSDYGNNGFAANSDYYVMKIKSVEAAGANTRITGTIRARFLYDSESLEIDFRVLVPYT